MTVTSRARWRPSRWVTVQTQQSADSNSCENDILILTLTLTNHDPVSPILGLVLDFLAPKTVRLRDCGGDRETTA